MEPPVTPKLMPASSPNLPTNHTSKLFGMVYVILTGVVDTIVPAARLWSWVGKSASYLLRLAPLLWWALPAKTLAQVIPKNSGPAAQDWVPDILVALWLSPYGRQKDHQLGAGIPVLNCDFLERSVIND
ncbi:hypothetical protein DSO57_1002468 [Entomophthora muscae]|uniref:Uncharacterized protein n=1 Tax=Entomophthora muscae TaxID=34485 RepID=A0ACC2TWF7_9FUNG|nr:hypothetical protein DSO57_1002468 [Entomophthora muscae]